MTDKLLPLPEPLSLHGSYRDWFTADQMHAYARAHLAAQQAQPAPVAWEPSDYEIRYAVNLPFLADEQGTEWVTLSPAMLARAVRRVLALRSQPVQGGQDQLRKLTLRYDLLLEKCRQLEFDAQTTPPAQPVQPEPVVWLKEKIEKHALRAADCPGASFVVLKSSLLRLLEKLPTTHAPATPQAEPVASRPDEWWDAAHKAAKAYINKGDKETRTACFLAGAMWGACVDVAPTPQAVPMTDEVFDLICGAIDKADTISMEGDYMLDSDDCINVVRTMQALLSIHHGITRLQQEGGVK